MSEASDEDLKFWHAVQGVVVVTPMCTKTPPARVATSQATQPEDAQGHHASHRSTQPTNNHDSHSSLSQGTRLAPAPVGPNTVSITDPHARPKAAAVTCTTMLDTALELWLHVGTRVSMSHQVWHTIACRDYGVHVSS